MSEKRIPARAPWSFVTPPVMRWAIRNRIPRLIVDGKEFPVKTLRIMANGTQDLCFVRDLDESAGYRFGSCLKEKPSPENLIWKPEGDIAIFEFQEDLPLSVGGRSILYFETKEMEPLLEEIVRRNPDYILGDMYEAYLGKDYGYD